MASMWDFTNNQNMWENEHFIPFLRVGEPPESRGYFGLPAYCSWGALKEVGVKITTNLGQVNSIL